LLSADGTAKDCRRPDRKKAAEAKSIFGKSAPENPHRGGKKRKKSDFWGRVASEDTDSLPWGRKRGGN